MSPDDTDSRSPGFRLDSLLQVRRWLIQLLLSEAWLFAALAGVASWSRLPGFDRALLIGGALCVVLGWVFGGRRIGLWLIVAGPLSLITAAALSSTPPSGPAWIALAVSVGHVTYALVLLLPVRVAPIAIPVGCVALGIIWATRPGNVVPGALAVVDGWISVASLAVSATALWIVWRALTTRALHEDDDVRQLTERLHGELAVQERSRIWRSATITIHERLLSTLRYLLQTDEVDRAGLSALVDTTARTTPSPAYADLAEEVRLATAARVAAGILRLDASALDLPLADDVRVAVRAALVECSLNAVLHGQASEVVIAATTTSDRCTVTVTDNGVGISSEAIPGLGWSATLGDGLAEVGGSWSATREGGRTVIRLDVPRLASPSGPAFADDGFQQGRVLMSTPLLAIGTVGLAFDVLIAFATPRAIPLILVAFLATAGAVVLVARGRRPSVLTSSSVLAGLAGIPWLMASARSDTDLAPVLVAGLTTAGYTLIAVGMWARWWQWLIAMGAWSVGVLLVARVDGTGEQLPIAVALVNCLIIVPVVIIVSAIGTRRYARATEASMLEREAMQREAIRANSALAINQHLNACVAQAEDIIERVASGADFDAPTRHEVTCLEGLIRATIQVDPTSSGEFAQAAARLVNTAFSQSTPVRVGTLMSSSDSRPVSAAVMHQLEAAISAYGAATVRALTDGTRDHLSIELTHPKADADGIVSGLRTMSVDDLSVEVSEDGDHCVVIVTRRISATV